MACCTRHMVQSAGLWTAALIDQRGCAHHPADCRAPAPPGWEGKRRHPGQRCCFAEQRRAESLTYATAGVDIDAGNELVRRIQKLNPQIGGFSGLVPFGELATLAPLLFSQAIMGTSRHGAGCSPTRQASPSTERGCAGDSYLVAGTDGVGTKLKLAFDLQKHDTIGIDLVAMSVNDIITSGAKPLFFLDYFATGKLDVDVAEAVRHVLQAA